MQILIADDERLTRLGLQTMLDELFPCEFTYLHARNGNEVAALLKEQQPDIAFLDIKMPVADGLWALEFCRHTSPSTICVILSGYADFSYAQQAIALSAFDYLLKPIEPDTLKKLFDRILASRASNQKHENAIFAHAVTRSFNMADQLPIGEVEFAPATESDYILYQFYIDLLDSKVQKRIKQKLCQNLNQFCNTSSRILNHCLFFNSDGNLCLVCDTPDASRLTHFISLQAEGLPPNSFSVFFGNKKNIRGIYEVSQRISKISRIRLLKNCSTPVFLGNIEALPFLSSYLALASAVLSVLNDYLLADWNAFRRSLDEMRYREELMEAYKMADALVLRNYLSGFFCESLTFTDWSELLRLLSHFGQRLSAGSGSEAADIHAVKEYICKNYSHDVSIACVSEYFHLSPSYLSRFFHEKTGQKYIDFVTQIRMDAACQLLSASPSRSIRQVAEAVGYSSVRHFSRMFQKYTGILPSEYHR